MSGLGARQKAAQRLRELADEFDASLEHHRQIFGSYCRQEHGRETSVAIVEHQLNKRDLGEESRICREAADLLDQPITQAMIDMTVDAAQGLGFDMCEAEARTILMLAMSTVSEHH